MNFFIALTLCLGAIFINAARNAATNDAIYTPDSFNDINKFLESLPPRKDTDGPEPIYEVVLTGTLAEVENLIRSGANVNVQAPNGWTALHMVAWKGYENIAEMLLRSGANINLKTNLEWTPLHTAAFNGHYRIVAMLVQRGAGINLKTNNGWTPLHAAAWKNHDNIVEYLIDKGAEVNSKNNRGNTALHTAAMEGRDNVVRILVRHRASVDLKSNDGWTALNAAAWHGHFKVVEALAKNGASIDLTDKDGKLPIYIATERGHRKVIEVLNKIVADRKVETNENSGKDFTAIKTACQRYSQPKASGSIESREYPWMASLGYLSSDYKVQFDCGGTIISEYFILTAAHCAKSSRLPVVARIGKPTNAAGDDGDSVVNMQIEEIIRHPSFSITTLKNDIALIRVKERIHFSKSIKPACLHTDTRDPHPSVQLIVTGFSGPLQQTDDSSVLVKKYLSPLQLSLCNSIYANDTEKSTRPAFRNGINKAQMCALDFIAKNDSCSGDGGGPLQMFIDNSAVSTVVGIVSFGVFPCGTSFPSIYTRVAHYADWIESVVWPSNSNV